MLSLPQALDHGPSLLALPPFRSMVSEAEVMDLSDLVVEAVLVEPLRNLSIFR